MDDDREADASVRAPFSDQRPGVEDHAKAIAASAGRRPPDLRYALWWLRGQHRTDHVPTVLRAQVYERDGHRCLRCGATEGPQADHVFPWRSGGPTTLRNLQTLCARCNQWQGARIIDFRPRSLLLLSERQP
jgi:5-methylcytosine-specific restriction endonuclease McrA